MTSDQSLGDGVFFAPDSYAGVFRRISAMITDGLILLIVAIGLWIPLVILLWDPQTGRTPEGLFLLLWIPIGWFYLTVIKRSRLRTIGYRLCGLQIVNTRGDRPTLTAMTLRLLLWGYGPFNFLLDLAWLAADTDQQSLRDCYSGTYVVRANAKPIGTGPLHLTRYFGAGLAPSYPRVVRS